MNAMTVNSNAEKVNLTECNKAVEGTFIGVYTVQALAIFVGNFLTCVVFLSERRLREVYMNVFLISLAISDFLVSVLIFPGYTIFCASCVTSLFARHHTVCVVFDGIKDYVLLANVFNILAITFDRYVAVIKPFHYMTIITKRSVTGILVCTWLIPWPLAYMKQIVEAISPTLFHSKKTSLIYDNVVVSVCVVLPMFLIAVVNATITKAIRKQMSRINHHGNAYVASYKVRSRDDVTMPRDEDSTPPALESRDSNEMSRDQDLPRPQGSRDMNDVSLHSCDRDAVPCSQPRTSREVTSSVYESRDNNNEDIFSGDKNVKEEQEQVQNGKENENTDSNSREGKWSIPDIRFSSTESPQDKQIQELGTTSHDHHVMMNDLPPDTPLAKDIVARDDHVVGSRTYDVTQLNADGISNDKGDTVPVKLIETEVKTKRDGSFDKDYITEQELDNMRQTSKVNPSEKKINESVDVDERFNENYLTESRIDMINYRANELEKNINSDDKTFDDSDIIQQEIQNLVEDNAKQQGNINQENKQSDINNIEEEEVVLDKERYGYEARSLRKRKFGSVSLPAGVTNGGFLAEGENGIPDKTMSVKDVTRNSSQELHYKDIGRASLPADLTNNSFVTNEENVILDETMSVNNDVERKSNEGLHCKDIGKDIALLENNARDSDIESHNNTYPQNTFASSIKEVHDSSNSLNIIKVMKSPVMQLCRSNLPLDKNIVNNSDKSSHSKVNTFKKSNPIKGSTTKPFNSKESSKSSKSLTNRLRKISRELKESSGTRCCLVVSMIFVICWIPRCLLNIFSLILSPGDIDDRLLEKISLLFLFFQSLTNPLVYSFYRKDFRKAARELMRKLID